MLNKNNKSGFTGVCFDKNNNKWKAFINISKKRIHLGYFTELYEAIEARSKMKLLNDFKNGKEDYKLLDFVLQKILYISQNKEFYNDKREICKTILSDSLYEYYGAKTTNREIFSNYFFNKVLEKLSTEKADIQKNDKLDFLVKNDEIIRLISNGLSIHQISLITKKHQKTINLKLKSLLV